ncbi:hypothetical protein [Brevibacterium samyangense]|uniref:Secreted protein n=1 Tax=Brevibacterium samyangense TaxID=366888 RepID=A0ABN2TH58_9MICO
MTRPTPRRARPRTTWTRRARLAVAVCAAAVLLGTGALAGATRTTDAYWVNPEYASGTVTAGRVLPATNPTCIKPLLGNLTFEWSHPSGGLTRTGYRWEVRQPSLLGLLETTASGTLGANATSISPSVNLTALGQGEFRLYAVHRAPGASVDWESVALVDTFVAVSALVVTC